MAIENRCHYCGTLLSDNTAGPHLCPRYTGAQPAPAMPQTTIMVPPLIITGHPCGTGCRHIAYEEEIATLRARIKDLESAQGASNMEDAMLGRFGHHPNPADDFCVEVTELMAIATDRKLGVANPDDASLEGRILRAMEFRVGGDQNCIDAKRELRALDALFCAQGARVPEGWKLGPKEPLPQMLEQAAYNLSESYGPGFTLDHREFALDAYRELLAASPPAPSAPSREPMTEVERKAIERELARHEDNAAAAESTGAFESEAYHDAIIKVLRAALGQEKG